MTIEIDRRVAHTGIAVIAIIALLWAGWHYLSPGRTVIDGERLTALDPDNAGINISVTQPWFTDSVLLFDVRRPDNRDFNRMDVTRCLLQCAQDLKHHDVARVYLANKGDRLYYIKGSDFRQLGEDYSRGKMLNNTLLATRIPTVTYMLNDSLAFPVHDSLIPPLDNASDWNTMMSSLMADESLSTLSRVIRFFF